MGHLRQPGESDIDFAKRRAVETGQLWAPNNIDGPNVGPADIAALTPQDSPLLEAFRGLSRMMVGDYAPAFAKHYGTTPDFDGKLDAALLEVMQLPRCDVPDYAPPPGAHFQFSDPLVQEVAERMQASPAIGGGNWPRCHDSGDFHCVVVRVSMSGRPSWATSAVMQAVWRNVQAAYDEIGLHIIYVDAQMKDLLTGADHSGKHVDTEASWQSLSGGAIGLAILTLGLNCQQNIWQRYHPSYQGGSSDESRIVQNSSLWRHEHGHNSGLNHTNGGTMNPSIVNNLPVKWTASDPSTPRLKSLYGGVPFPGTAPGPGPGPTPTPIEKRVESLEQKQFEDNITNAIQDVKIQLLDGRVKALEARA